LGRLATNTRTGTNGWRFLRMPQGNGFRATISMIRDFNHRYETWIDCPTRISG
jgi:hypothetical protein